MPRIDWSDRRSRPPWRRHRSIVKEAPKLTASARMLELAQRLCLDLADALTGHRKLLADLLQRMVGVHADAETHPQNTLFTRGKRSQHSRGGLPQVRLNRRVDWQHRVLVLNKVAEVAVLLVADRRLEADRLL